MAVILLQAAGAALGGVFGSVGAAIGQAAGALAGGLIDNSLINSTRTIAGRGLPGARIASADEGAPIARVYGTMRIAGTLIWATRFEETVTVERQGGKAGGPKVQKFSYHANFAIGLCEGPIAGIRRVWADGRELDLTSVEMRIHRGAADQMSDPLIEAKQGAGNAPAFRNLAYAVFERLPLDGFGNRIPMLQFEVIRPLGELENRIEAVAVIPGATEHGYALTPVFELPRPGEKRFLNRNSRIGDTDWSVSIDELQALCPNLKSVALVTSWVGTDLRADRCQFLPGFETSQRNGESRPWRVGGLTRSTARLISHKDGAPIYGGTPDDLAVIEAIADLKARGLAVTLYPFVLMDIPEGNGLPDPYGGPEQAALPWRGRVTSMPAPGEAGTPDRTATARAVIDALCGATMPAHIQISGSTVTWNGGDAGYRRMILHHAGLALAAGGVDGFLIGSEMTGLTRLRDEVNAFPFVEALVSLAADVKSMLGPETAVTYAADWSEYFGYHPPDGSGDVFFNLDPLWASPAIDAVGIDNYMPLSDWRDADLEAGNPDDARHANDPAAFERTISSGEGFDWYYASAGDRRARIRTPISDGQAGKDWVFRYKDIRSWWQNAHFDRINGVEMAASTAWVPGSKPVWFTELGCPAVDKGANQPNLFPDTASSEGGLPWHSSGARDDNAQRRLLEAHLRHWTGEANADGMVATDRIHLWAWDARPYPAFPEQASLWADGLNWRTGHWLNGRLGGAPLAELIAAILADAGIDRFDVSGVEGFLAGYVAADTSSARALLGPLIEAHAIDVSEGQTGLVFVSRLVSASAPAGLEIIADPTDAPLYEETRAQESELANEAVLAHFDPATDYSPASARSRRLSGGVPRQNRLAVPAALDTGIARTVADGWLRDQWAGRRRLRFSLPPSAQQFEAGDIVSLSMPDAPAGRFRITRIEDGESRKILAVGHVSVPARESGAQQLARRPDDANAGFAPELVLLDLPLIKGTDETAWACAAAHLKPWRPLVISASSENEGYVQRARLESPARMGRLVQPLPAGEIEWSIDHASVVEVDIDFGGLESVTRTGLLDGANGAAVMALNGVWEIIQFETATETAPGRWRLENLLRGQSGTDDAMRAGAGVGARFVMLDTAVRPLGLTIDEAGRSRNFIAEVSGLAVEPTSPQAFAGGERARMPLSPVHLRARRQEAGITLSWVRRGRIDADSWNLADIANDEGQERYRVEVLGGAGVVRTAEVTAPEWFYPVSEELGDFGDVLSEISVRVAQAGKGVPWGIARQATISL